MKPAHYLFAYSPRSGRVHLTHDGEHHPAQVKTHRDLARDIGEHDLVHGYAYRIRGGWRVTDYDHDPLTDGFIRRRVVETINAREDPSHVLPDDPTHEATASNEEAARGPSHLVRVHHGRVL